MTAHAAQPRTGTPPTDTNLRGLALELPLNPLWWLGLINGVLMTGIAFWTAGQFFFEKAYVLLVFAGIWALMQGVSNVVRAFSVRGLHEQLDG